MRRRRVSARVEVAGEVEVEVAIVGSAVESRREVAERRSEMN